MILESASVNLIRQFAFRSSPILPRSINAAFALEVTFPPPPSHARSCFRARQPRSRQPAPPIPCMQAAPSKRKVTCSICITCIPARPLNVVYRVGNDYVPGALAKLNYFLRDHRTNDVSHYDVREFDLLHSVMSKLGKPNGVIDVVCGYRTPWSNEFLRSQAAVTGVARNSQHTQAKAIDIRVPGVRTSKLRGRCTLAPRRRRRLLPHLAVCACGRGAGPHLDLHRLGRIETPGFGERPCPRRMASGKARPHGRAFLLRSISLRVPTPVLVAIARRGGICC